MKLYSKQEAIARMNMLAGCSKSFVFLIDYSQEQVYVEETAEVSPEELIYNLNGSHSLFLFRNTGELSGM